MLDKPQSPMELYEIDPTAAASEVIRRSNALRSHDFDERTGYCIACGQAAERVLDLFQPCFGQPKVIAISHLRARSRMQQMFGGAA